MARRSTIHGCSVSSDRRRGEHSMSARGRVPGATRTIFRSRGLLGRGPFSRAPMHDDTAVTPGALLMVVARCTSGLVAPGVQRTLWHAKTLPCQAPHWRARREARHSSGAKNGSAGWTATRSPPNLAVGYGWPPGDVGGFWRGTAARVLGQETARRYRRGPLRAARPNTIV